MNGTAYTMRERRSTIDGALIFTQGESAGKARWMDVSRVGAQIRLNRFLVPGRVIRLHFSAKKGAGHVTMDARVVWCTRLPGTTDFVAGLAVRRTEPAAALAFATLRETAPALNESESVRVRLPRWAALDAAGESGNGVTAHNTLQHAI